MGGCASTPAPAPAAASAAKAQTGGTTARAAGPNNGSHGSPAVASADTMASQPTASKADAEGIALEHLNKVTQLLAGLAEVRGLPLEQLQGAAELVAAELNASLVSIAVLTDLPTMSSTCIAAGGPDAGLAQLGIPVPLDVLASSGAKQTSVQMLLETKTFIQASPSSAAHANSSAYTKALPSDWQMLHKQGGLNSFMAVPINRGGRIFGVLTVASTEVDKSASMGLVQLLEAASTWVSLWLETGGALRLGQLNTEVWLAGDVEGLVRAVCQGLQDHFKARMQLKLAARVALLGGSSSAIIYEEQQGGVGLSPCPSSNCLPLLMDDQPQDSPKPSAQRRPSSTAGDLQGKLRAIRNSLAVSSLEDLRNLTNAITTNDNAREMFASESLPYAQAAYYGSSPTVYSQPPASPALQAPLGSRAMSGSLHANSVSLAKISSPTYNMTEGGRNPEGSVHHGHLHKRSTELRGSNPGGTSRTAISNQNSLQGISPGTTAVIDRVSYNSGAPTHPRSPLHSSTAAAGIQPQGSQGVALTEDVLLRMVQEADDGPPAPTQLVAHGLVSLDRTLLGHVMGMKTPPKGTWISDVATYMTQPNRPGRDMVVSPRSAAVASLVLACMAASDPATSSAARNRLLSTGNMSLTGNEDQHGADGAVMAIYLTSGSPLSPLQLQAVLRELHLVLALLHQPVAIRLGVGLREEWTNILANVLGQGPPSLLSESFTSAILASGMGGGALMSAPSSPYFGSANGTPNSPRKPAGKSGNGGLLTLLMGKGGQAGQPPRTSSESAGVSWLDGPGSANGVASAGSNLHPDGMFSSRSIGPEQQRARSFSNGGPIVYSRGPLVPQVAPLVAGLQDRLRTLLAARTHTSVYNRHDDLAAVKAEALIAHGGFGSVYQGLWQGLEVAIKVIPQRMDHSESVREAVELAVMTTVSHPNILGVQNYWTDVLATTTPLTSGERRPNGLLRLESALELHADDMVDLPGHSPSMRGTANGTGVNSPSYPGPSGSTRGNGQGSSINGKDNSGGGSGTPSHLHQLRRGSSSSMNPSADAKRSLVIVMELCDQGSLDEAIHRGAFRLVIPGKSPRINMLAVLTTLLEVAMALRHMHSMQLVHCDLKPGNVLLKSSLSDVRQFTTKLCDFGLVKLRQEALDLTEQIRRSTFTGTVTHSPPEMLRGDPNPQFSYDIYAFGILMWELISSTPVYQGLSDRQVAQQVVYNNLRPEFPRGMDPQYKELAHRCWAADPGDRPTSDQVVQSISGMLMSLRERAAAAAAAASAMANVRQAPTPVPQQQPYPPQQQAHHHHQQQQQQQHQQQQQQHHYGHHQQGHHVQQQVQQQQHHHQMQQAQLAQHPQASQQPGRHHLPNQI